MVRPQMESCMPAPLCLIRQIRKGDVPDAGGNDLFTPGRAGPAINAES